MPLTAQHVYPRSTPDAGYGPGSEPSVFMQFPSRRSVVHSTGGMVACTQPLAAEAGQRVLKMGGNAADAAVAVAAALNMTEPCNTGIGGDAFCLFFDAKTKKVHSLNGSGRAPKHTTLAQLREEFEIPEGIPGSIPALSPLAVTVPGAAAAWCDTIEKFGSGKLTMEQILAPAIELGEKGFPVSELISGLWQRGEQALKDASPNFRELLRKDPKARDFARAPLPGEIIKNPALAATFRTLAAEGKKGFYTGRIADAIVDVMKLTGGYLDHEDLQDHLRHGTQETEAISLKFTGQNLAARQVPGHESNYAVELWEHPPNGQGIVALMTLGILEELERMGKIRTFAQEDHNCADYLHAVIESLRIAFTDANWWVADPDHSPVKPTDMISRPYLAERAKLFDATKVNKDVVRGQPGPSPAQSASDTVYFCTADAEGNGMSFINSNYMGFGSHIVPAGCGFSLQNRGANFKLGPEDHPNIYRGGKRPYHTIIPGMLTHGDGDQRELHSVYGVMGGFMQPQGHVQVLLNMEVFGLNPQQALDAPRICIGGGYDQAMKVFAEEGIDENVVKVLQKMGHNVELLYGHDREMFGRGQVIRRHVDPVFSMAVYSGGSDPRGDGCAMPA